MRTKNLFNKHRLNVCFFSADMLGHCINVDPIPFAFLGMVIWSEGVPYLGHAKHPLYKNLLVGAGGFRELFHRVLRHETAVDQHRRTVRTNEGRDDMVARSAVSRAWADDYCVVIVPLPAHEHLTVDEFWDDRQTNEGVDPFSDWEAFLGEDVRT